MTALTQAQQRHLIKRINEMYEGTLRNMNNYHKAPQPPAITGDELVRVIKSGKLKLREGYSGTTKIAYGYVHNIFDIDAYLSTTAAHKAYKRDVEDHKSAKNKLATEHRALIDNVMLGDSKDALKLLADFQTTCDKITAKLTPKEV